VAHFSVKKPAQLWVKINNSAHLAKTVDNNHAERRRVTVGLAELGLEVAPSQANFVMFDCPEGSDAESMTAALVARGVMVRPAFYLPQHIRVTVGTPADNSRFLAAVKSILEN
jgi:histidinol-phosphate aminotransferase